MTEWFRDVIATATDRFTGRVEERSRIAAFLADEEARLLFLIGPPGIGKTSLLATLSDAGCRYFFQGTREDAHAALPFLRTLSNQVAERYGCSAVATSDETPGAYLGVLAAQLGQVGQMALFVDALDEAATETDLWNQFVPIVMRMPCHTIISGRPDILECEPFHSWLADPRVRRLDVGPLLPTDVQTLLADVPSSAASVIGRLAEGNPLCLRLLTEELARGTDLASLSSGLDAVFVHLARSRADALPALQVLAVARDAMTWAELRQILARAPDLGDLLRVTVMVGQDRYRLFHQGFKDCLLRSFDTSEARRRVLDFCGRWRQTKSPYALRTLAGHLLEVGRTEELYSLARDKEFVRTSLEVLPLEPTAALAPLRYALSAAIADNNAVAMAEMLLLQRQCRTEMQQLSPLEVLRKGDLARAQALCDLGAPHEQAAWHVLLASELKDKGAHQEAIQMLERMGKPVLAALVWMNNLRPFLIDLASLEPTLVCHIAEAYDDQSFPSVRCRIANRLARQGDWLRAEAVVSALDEPNKKRALEFLLHRAAEQEAWDKAEALLVRPEDEDDGNLSFVRCVVDKQAWDMAVRALDFQSPLCGREARAVVVAGLLKAGLLDRACEVAEAETYPAAQSLLLAQVARALHGVGDTRRASGLQERAASAACDVEAWCAVAWTWAVIGDAEKASLAWTHVEQGLAADSVQDSKRNRYAGIRKQEAVGKVGRAMVASGARDRARRLLLVDGLDMTETQVALGFWDDVVADDPGVKTAKGRHFIAQGDYAQALEFDKSLRPEVASRLYADGRTEEAVREFRQAAAAAESTNDPSERIGACHELFESVPDELLELRLHLAMIARTSLSEVDEATGMESHHVAEMLAQVGEWEALLVVLGKQRGSSNLIEHFLGSRYVSMAQGRDLMALELTPRPSLQEDAWSMQIGLARRRRVWLATNYYGKWRTVPEEESRRTKRTVHKARRMMRDGEFDLAVHFSDSFAVPEDRDEFVSEAIAHDIETTGGMRSVDLLSRIATTTTRVRTACDGAWRLDQSADERRADTVLASSNPQCALTHAWVARAYANLAVRETSLLHLARAAELQSELDDPAQASQSLWVQAEAWVVLGEMEKAERLFGESLDTARTIVVEEDRDYAVAQLAGAAASCGYVDVAKICLALVHPASDLRTWPEELVVSCLARHGRPDEAYNLLAHGDDDSFERSKQFVSIAVGYASAGNVERAMELTEKVKSTWRDMAIIEIAEELAWAGKGPQAVQLAMESPRFVGAMGVATALVAIGDLESFKRLLPWSTSEPFILFTMLRLLARAYPDAAAAIDATLTRV